LSRDGLRESLGSQKTIIEFGNRIGFREIEVFLSPLRAQKNQQVNQDRPQKITSMRGVADELAQQGLVGGEKMRKHPVNERVHHDSQNLGGPRRGRERVKDAVPSRKLLEILRIHDKNQEQDLVREELVEIPQTRTRTRRGRPCPRRAADEPGVNEQRRRSPSRSCGRRSEPTTGFRHRKPDEEADAPGNHQTREDRKMVRSRASQEPNDQKTSLSLPSQKARDRRENGGKRPLPGGTGP
jgi:hypothetical protein